MDYDELLEAALELGYQMALCGAETYRVEESVRRMLKSYGTHGEVWAIPNCIIISMDTGDECPRTRMRRIPNHGTDLDGVERFSALSRRLCAQRPSLPEAMELLAQARAGKRVYPLAVQLGADFLAAGGFTVFSGGRLTDFFGSGLCGIATGLCLRAMGRLNTNTFFKTVVSGFIMALLACMLERAGAASNVDAVIIGALMILVPGLLFINSVRDVIYGDTNSGINRLVEVLIIAVALAVGTGAAVSLSRTLFGAAERMSTQSWPLPLECLACFIGCLGFAGLFNLHGRGVWLCVTGSILCWLTYRLGLHLGCTDLMSFFLASLAASFYAEIMARVRKFPAASYLIVSLFPLIPGGGIYYAMDHMVRGELNEFTATGLHTAGIAGVMAVAIILVATLFRMWGMRNKRKL